MRIVYSIRTFLALALAGLLALIMPADPTQAQGTKAPQFRVEPMWPQPLPANWILGQVAGVAVGNDDTVWIIHRPGTQLDDEKGAMQTPPATKCCKPAPPVLQFDSSGKLLRSWGGPGAGYDWPKNEHGIHIDKAGNVWIGGNDSQDHQLLKFSPEGKFIFQIGKPKATAGSNSHDQLGRPAHMFTDDDVGEIYVADGYLNRRVIVFDMKTGAYKRHWGAYGTKEATDEKLPPYSPQAILSKSFGNPVHCVRISNDGLVYVCDRTNDRIQVFKKDGAYVTEFRVEPDTLQNGSVWDLVLSRDKEQRYIFVADGANDQIHTLDRKTGKMIGSFGRGGRQPGQFLWVHNMAIDSKGNLFTSEVGYGRRVQKFTLAR